MRWRSTASFNSGLTFIFSENSSAKALAPWIDERQQYVGPPNSQRFPTYFSLDLKAYREFRIPFWGKRSGKVHHFRFGVYTLNVTDHGNFSTVYNNVTSPYYGRFVGFLYRHEGMLFDFVG